MSALRSKALLLIALLVVSVCMVTFLVVRQERAKEDGQVRGEIPGEALPKQLEGDGQVTVKIAGEAFSLVFEAGDVPSVLRNTIATDLGRALSYLTEARFEELKNSRRLSWVGRDLEVTHKLVTRGPHTPALPNILPRPLKRDFGEAVTTNGGYALVVRTSVIEAYVRATELKERYPDMFARLDEFIDLLNDQKRMKEIGQNWETCADYVYRFRGVSMQTALEFVREYASIEDISVKYPSLLDIIPSSAIEPGAPEDIHVMASVVEGKEHGVQKIDKLPLGAYVDGRWRIFTFHMP